jgi:hypothetical protein
MLFGERDNAGGIEMDWGSTPLIALSRLFTPGLSLFKLAKAIAVLEIW